MRPRPPYRHTLRAVIADALAFLIALTTPFSVKLVGSLPVSEIVLLPLVPVFLISLKRRLTQPTLKAIFFLIGLWLFGQVLTDLYRHTPAVDWMRGDAAILFFAMDIACLTVLLAGSNRRKAIFVTGYAIGTFLTTKLVPSTFSQGQPWKFGYAGGTILLVVLGSCYFYSRRQYSAVGIVFAGIIFINLLENYRSPVLNLLVAMVLVVPIIPERIGRLRLLPRRGSVMRIAVLTGMAVGGGLSASALVHLATTAGLVSEEARMKNEEQGEGTGILLGGRPEILVSSIAVMDSPVLGHGSWAKEAKYDELMSDLMVEQGKKSYLRDTVVESEGLIQAHSHLMGAWVWAGLLGAVFWLYLFWLVIKAIVRVTIILPPMAPLYAYLLVEYAWAILFSPFGSTLRIYESLVIVIIIDLLPESAPRKIVALGQTQKRMWRRGALAAQRS
jgi:hypothetical protein